MEVYDIFDKQTHLQPDFEKIKFDTVHSWDLGWELLEPINIARSSDEDKELSKRFSPGQKTLYFFWYLDAQVTNGGFLQFYTNGYRHYLPTINAGLELIGDHKLLSLLLEVEKVYLIQEKRIKKQMESDKWEPDPVLIEVFDKYDSEFYKIHDGTMALIEKYARQHLDEFVRLKGNEQL